MVKGVEKKNKIFFIVLFVVLVAIVIVFGLQTYTPEIKAYSNMTDLYSLFTENMQEFVDYRLGLVDCSPSKYYYENSTVCFVCLSTVCFVCLLRLWLGQLGWRKNESKMGALSEKHRRNQRKSSRFL